MTGENLIEFATYRRTTPAHGAARSAQREADYHKEANALLDKLRTTKRVFKTDRSALARNLGRLLVRLDAEDHMQAARKILQPSCWAKRKRYIRFASDTTKRSGTYGASGGNFAGIVQGLIDEKVRRGVDRTQATIETVYHTLKGTSFRPSPRFQMNERADAAASPHDAAVLIKKMEKVLAKLDEIAELADFFEFVSKHPIYPVGLRLRDLSSPTPLLILDADLEPNDVDKWQEWVIEDEFQNWIPWWAPKCVIGHLYLPFDTKCLALPNQAVAAIKELCGGVVTEDSWRPVKDDCLCEVEPFRASEFVGAGTVFHRLAIWLIALPWSKKLVPCLYASIDLRVDEFQIEQCVKYETYSSYVDATSPCFVDRLGERLATDMVYFSGDENDEEPLYICHLKDGINVIGSGIDNQASNFKANLCAPLLSNEIPEWFQEHPVQQLLKLTPGAATAVAFALAPRRFAKVDTRWVGDGETIFRPAFSDSFTRPTELRPDTIGAYLLRNFAFAEDNGIFEALKNDAFAKDTASRGLMDAELSRGQAAFDERFGK